MVAPVLHKIKKPMIFNSLENVHWNASPMVFVTWKLLDSCIQTYYRDEDVCYSTQTVSRVCDSALVAVRCVYFSIESTAFVQFESEYDRLMLNHLSCHDDDDAAAAVEWFYFYSMQSMDLQLL